MERNNETNGQWLTLETKGQGHRKAITEVLFLKSKAFISFEQKKLFFNQICLIRRKVINVPIMNCFLLSEPIIFGWD